MIDSQTKQRILDAANILEVVSDFVSLRRSGTSYIGLCPFHSDRKPSFSVSPAKNVCKCFSCGEGGSPVHFVMRHEQMSYSEALRYLAKKYHIEIVEREETDEERIAASERQSLFLINEYAQSFFQEQLNDTEEGRNIGLAYFRERGIRPETIKLFGLGYSPEARSALTNKALAAGYTLDRLSKVGVSIQYDDGRAPLDRFRGRVIFPVRNLSGQYVAFGGRVMGKADKTAKYINSPESPIYSKSRELYGLYQAKSAISKANKCYLVEGYTDVISMHQSGIANVVSSSGTALTTQQIRLLRRFSEHITVLYDGDSAGIKAALRGIDLLLEEGLDIKVVLLPQGEDPDSYARSHTAEQFVSYLDENETDFIHFKIELYRDEMQRDPIKRAELISDILRSIALIPDTIRRTVLIQSSANELRMSEQLLTSEVNKLRAEGIRAAGNYVPQPAVEPHPIANTSPTPTEHVDSPDTSVSTDEPHRYELDLLRLVVQNGHNELYLPAQGEDGSSIYRAHYVAEFVHNELELDTILDNLSHTARTMLVEAYTYCVPNQIGCSKYFINHDSEIIRRVSSDLLAHDMEIQTSRSDDAMEAMLLGEVASANTPEKQARAIAELDAHRTTRQIKAKVELGTIVLRELDNIRMALVIQNIYEIQAELRTAQQQGDEARQIELIRELQELNQLKIEFAQSLGERTIIG